MSTDMKRRTRLNGVCAYFTMFPLDFPYSILSRHATAGEWVMDPFCGRGTTNYASRLLDLPSIGIDSSPVAAALSQAKLVNVAPANIVRAAQCILEANMAPVKVPCGEFWDLAYDRQVLDTLCRLREGLLQDCRSDARKALRAVLMGALHGPQPKGRPSYFSNQAPRTYAPKPRYAVSYWKRHGMAAPQVDMIAVIAERAERFYGQEVKTAVGTIIRGDSRERATYLALPAAGRVRWVITSPPYYGMRTYIPDQWLRNWFVGGPSDVDYSTAGQIMHSSPTVLASQLRQVWQHVGGACMAGAQMVVRFGGINDRKVDPLTILMGSLDGSGWGMDTTEHAGAASLGRRQALHFSGARTTPVDEYDVWATWRG